MPSDGRKLARRAGEARGRARGSRAGNGDDSRYERLRDLLDLCVRLQGSLQGLSKDDVAEAYGTSPRTAHRMLAAVRDALGEDAFETVTGADRVKRWRLRHALTPAAVRWSAADLAALDAAAKAAERDGRRDQAHSLRATLARIRALLAPRAGLRIDPDLEALMEAQGVAMRPGPQPRIARQHVYELREAILALKKVRLRHRNADSGEIRRHVVGPLGFLYGPRHYLVAWHARRRMPLLFRLSRVESVSVLDEPFEAPPDFDLRAFAERSFGTFQEEPVDVEWRFHPEVADEAREWIFHPHQQVEEKPDGSLRVRFRAGGQLEMAWHLFTWGSGVEVVRPVELRERLVGLLREALEASTPRRA